MNQQQKEVIDRYKKRYPPNMRNAFLRGLFFGGKNPYQNTTKVNGQPNFGKAFYNAFHQGVQLGKKLGVGQQELKFE